MPVVLFQPFSDDDLSLFDGCENVRLWHKADICPLALDERRRPNPLTKKTHYPCPRAKIGAHLIHGSLRAIPLGQQQWVRSLSRIVVKTVVVTRDA